MIPGTLRDSLFILQGLLEQQSDLQPKELMTDNAGVSDIVFALFWLLGYQFSPRLADIGGSRLWRINPKADYGVLNDLSRHKLNTKRIDRHWDDFLRLTASLKMGMVNASQLMRSLFRTKRPSSLTRALMELGRISKTIHHLNYINNESYRRRTLIQLNRGESRNGVSREVFHGRRGELRQRYQTGQEEQLGSLGLVVNILTLWNTIYIQEAIQHLKQTGMKINNDDIGRLSPLSYDNFNFLGSYSFNLAPEIADGSLRPLRKPETPEIIMS